MSRAVAILLVKHPRRGEVKGRLGRHLDQEVVVELYRNFVLDILTALDEAGVRHSVAFHPPRAEEALRNWLGPDRSYFAQRGGDPPERAMNTLADAFSRGEARAVILASDVPDIAGEVIVEALAALEDHDAVIGPSPDGGYYLIGFRREAFLPEAFQGIGWSTPSALRDTLARLDGLAVHHLPAWSDVDTMDDLLALTREERNPRFRSSRTMAFLREHGLAGR